MEGAINSVTKKYIMALSIGLDSSYQFPKEEKWYLDPNDIIDYDKEKIKDVTKIEVGYRKGNDSVINWAGTEYAIAPCFFIKNKTDLGINIVPESKEHKLAKNWIYNRLINKNLSFKFAKISKPFEYDNEININELNINYDKIGIEVTVKNNKTQRADIILPFKKYDKLFGSGIVVEIQFSKQFESTTTKRNNEWGFKGYSICWLWKDDFENISENLIELKEDTIKLEPLQKIMHEFAENNLYDFKHKLQEISRMIEEKMHELKYPFLIGECKKCNRGYMAKKQNKSTKKYFYSCSNWQEGCKHSINILDGEN